MRLMKPLKDEILKVVDSLKRGSAGHAYGGHGDRFVVAVGSPNAVQIAGVPGVVVTVGIDKEQAKDLRAALDVWIAE